MNERHRVSFNYTFNKHAARTCALCHTLYRTAGQSHRRVQVVHCTRRPAKGHWIQAPVLATLSQRRPARCAPGFDTDGADISLQPQPWLTLGRRGPWSNRRPGSTLAVYGPHRVLKCINVASAFAPSSYLPLPFLARPFPLLPFSFFSTCYHFSLSHVQRLNLHLLGSSVSSRPLEGCGWQRVKDDMRQEAEHPPHESLAVEMPKTLES